VLIDFSRRPGVRHSPTGAVAHTESLTARWTARLLRFRWAVLAAWLAVAVAGAFASAGLPRRLVNSFDVPHTDSQRAEAALARGFGERPEGTFTVVFRVRHSSSALVQARLRARLARAAQVLPGGRVGVFRVGPGVVYGDLQSRLSLQRAEGYTGALRRTLGGDAIVTGQPAIQHDLTPRLAADLRRGEAFALPLALLVLVAVLGISLAVAVPFVFAACTIGGALVVLYGATHLFSVSSYATNVVELIGLGLAIDYSLLVVCRYREELPRSSTREEAIARTMASTGRTVLFSGAAVAIGLALLLAVPVPFIRTIGVGGLLVPVVSMIAAITLQPVLLSLVGPRARASRSRTLWSRVARSVTRRPLAVLVPTVALLVAAATPLFALRLSPGSLAALPRSLEATRGLSVLTGAFGPGALTPTEIVVDSGSPAGARRPEVRRPVVRLVDRLFHDPEVSIVATGTTPPYVSSDGRYARVIVIGRHEYGAAESRRLVDRVRGELVPAARFSGRVRVLAGGAPPKGSDFLRRSYGFLPWLIAAVLLVTYGVLARAFRSLLLPLQAVLLNLLSVAASCGLLVAVFQYGVGAGAIGVQRVDAIDGWVPVVLFATLFGLSMDYEVFLVSRIREAWEARNDTTEAVKTGLERTGGLITAAAVVMAVSFAGFLLGSVPGLEQLGLGLTLAVLIDATLVRGLLVPSVTAMLGPWNWWMPRRVGSRSAERLKGAFDEA
jgi:putative drug exporter of the RND superfamily